MIVVFDLGEALTLAASIIAVVGGASSFWHFLKRKWRE